MAYQERILYLRSLKEGWNNGKGKPPTQEALATAALLVRCDSNIATISSIFPTDAGELLFEFVRDGQDQSIEIEPDGSIEMYAVEIDD